MLRHSACFHRLRMVLALLLAALFLAAFVPAAPAIAQTADDTKPLETVRLELDRIDAALKRENLSGQILYDLGQALAPLRDELRAKIAEVEPLHAQVEARLKQLGPPPAKDAPPEDTAIAEERARLNQEFAALDSALKQARVLSARADQIADQITERRRSLHTQQLFEQGPSVLSPHIWSDAARAFVVELANLGSLARSWWELVTDRDGLIRSAIAAVVLAVLGAALTMLWRWWQRRIVATPGAATRFGKALTSLGVLLRIAVTAPLVAIAVVLVLENLQLLPDRILEISYGIGMAVAIAAVGRAIAEGVLAPARPVRRLLDLDDAMAQSLTGHFTWAARIMAVVAVALVAHRVLDASPVLLTATNMLFGLAIGALLAHLLWVSNRGEPETEVLPRALWLRAVGWLVLIVMAAALLFGYVGFAAFLSVRLIATVAVLGVLYLLLVLTQSLFVERLGAGTARGRALALNFGVSPRRLGLIASIISGTLSAFLVLVALILIVGPWEVTTGDFIETLRGLAFGFRIGEITISFGAIFTAVLLLLLVLLITRTVQRWLERNLLPRTDLEPSLQQSIAAIVGYVGVIVAIVVALAQLGIDLQKVALIAGALSVGIGFGLQSIVSNFVSGLILLAERPIRVGDWVVVKGEEGYVRHIRVRATEIETFERASVIIPNADFISGPVKNWTHVNTTGRIIIKIGVSYDCDAEKVREMLLACAREHPNVLEHPPSRALLLGFGAIALEFELRAFVRDVNEALVTRSDLHIAILRRLREAGVAIPLAPSGGTYPAPPDGALPGAAG